MDYIITAPSQLGKVLKGRRGSLQLTQKAAGDKVGVLPKTMSALENSSEKSTVETLFKCLSALDLELVLRPKELSRREGERLEW